MMIPRLLLLLATVSFAPLTAACAGSPAADDEEQASALETEGDARTRPLLALDGPFFRNTATCDSTCARKPPSERVWRAPLGAAAVGPGQLKIEFLEPMPALGDARSVPTRRARLTTDIPGILADDPRTAFSQELVLEGTRPTGSMGNTPTQIVEKAFLAEVPIEGGAGARTVQFVLAIDVRGRVNNVFLRVSHQREDDSGILLTSIFTNVTPGASPAPAPAPSEECWVDHVGDRCPPAERERIP